MRVKLTPKQRRIFDAPQRFKAVVAGRKFGKTFLALTWLLAGALSVENSNNWYIAPTYRMAKRIAWLDLQRLSPPGAILDKNKSELSITYINGATISLIGANDPDSLRGIPKLHRAVLDEYAQQAAEVWPEVIRPSLAPTEGPAMFIGTPTGFNHFYELYNNYLTDSDWMSWQFTTRQGRLISDKEIEAMRRTMPERTFQQEIEAMFTTLMGRVYYAFDRALHIRNDIKFHKGLPIKIGIDFNVSPGMHAVISQKVAGQVHVVDELYMENGNTEELARECVRRYAMTPNSNGLITKNELEAFPDPTGKSRHTNAPVGVTDLTILKQFGMKVKAPDDSYAVADKINTVNAALKSAAGGVQVFVHPRCKRLITGFEGLTYKKDTNQPDKSGNLDHITDAAAYLICYELPIKKGGLLYSGAIK